MHAIQLALLYALIGGGAVVVLAVHRARVGARWYDYALVLAFWPLYGPLLIAGAAVTQEAPTFESRLDAARGRVREIDRLLAEPDFDLAAAEARCAQLEGGAAESARGRVEAIHRLQHVRDELIDELTEIDELTARLRVQSELARLAGDEDGARDLVDELTDRVHALDAMIEVAATVGCRGGSVRRVG